MSAPKNRIQDRVDRRLKKNQNPNKRTVMVIRQRGEKGEGANKTLTFLTKSENQKSAMALALQNIALRLAPLSTQMIITLMTSSTVNY